MTASILWKPLDEGTSLDVNGPSTFISEMEKVFGAFPTVLDTDDIPRLEVLAALNEGDSVNPYEELIQVLRKASTIEVWAVY